MIFNFFLCKLQSNFNQNRMLSHKIQFRVRYGETDQMGYVYYGNYAQYFEMGRVEWLRNLGISYKEMEANGIMLPVINMNISYKKPAKYDELLTLKTTLLKLPSAKIEFDFELFNETGELLTQAYVSLVFIDIAKNRPVKAPELIIKKLSAYF